jgi:hypothetical protein
LLGGTITTTGTLLLDSAVVFTRIRDSIVDVAIGNDTIKILKQEYAPALTSVLTWTITSKFPIQLKAYILVFRNGQLLNNDQFNLTDTNQITIVSTSFKVGANYTVATVSGIGSVGSAQGDPVYPEAGIAVSTGTTWTTSIPNNSNSWNIAFNDKINNAVFSGTDTKTLTLTQYDGGTFAPTFTDLQGVTGVTAGTGLTGGTITTTGTLAVDTSFLFTQSDTLSLNLTSRFAAKQNTLDGTGFVKASGTNITYDNSTYLRTGLADSTYLKLTGGTLTGNLRLSSSNATQLSIDANDNNLESRITFSTAGSARSKIYTTSSVSSMTFESIAQASAKRGFRFISSTEETQYLGLVQDPQGNVGIKSDATGNDVHPNTLYVNGTLGVTGNITEGGNNVLTNLDTASLSSRINVKLSPSDTVSLSNRINNKVGLTGNETVAGEKTFTNQVNMSGQITISGSVSGSNRLLGKNTSNNGVGDITVGTGLSLASNILTASGTDTTFLSDRINLKYNSSGGTISGAVTLNDELNLSSGYLKRGYLSSTSTSITVGDNDTWLNIHQDAEVTITLPLASSYNGRELIIKQTGSGVVTSASSNIIGFTTAFNGSTQTAIINPANYRFATLVSDGTNWIIMQRNN